ncbi:phosphatases II [Eremomyces bilateralis CBS 781.70]|uniref:Phosphatases II n=1 Tax=Eremomyces bilateralis CBS 781.70 TaxID=1392243 RepID=A0A6G1FYM8_9PEZI|nr:phosphatases II [Eremomyces bilateralis CBS 781.70]KAF1810884.1 phosphatases II [Eremomyces bilateralis CBS 781.70]
MDKIRISKVEDVTLWRQGQKAIGILHLTPHHLIFTYIPPPSKLPSDQQPPPDKPPRQREIWITYPMISFCTYRPAYVATLSRQHSSIRLRCRDFMFVAFQFVVEEQARQVYDTIRSLTCKLGRIDKLYAFSYEPQSPEKELNGWDLYDAAKEWRRLGVGEKDSDKGWRISTINQDYKYSPTYPALLPVPSCISDNTLNYAGRYRSKVRIPVLSYLHPINHCTITRSSQPLVGVRNHRSVQDERLLAAIFATSERGGESMESSASSASNVTVEGASGPSQGGSSQGEPPLPATEDGSYADAEAIENQVLARMNGQREEGMVKVYGAQQSNLIVDARPGINALVNHAQGMGSENMDNYKFATKAYLGIGNIHVMRESLQTVIEALKDADYTTLPPNREQLTKSGWIKHITSILDGAALVARQVGIHHSHVLIHCSDGWDRTSQLSCLAQMCLDPYYRTLEGFMVLVEKDFLSFGHMFRHRSGFLSSEKWFDIENERIGGNRVTSGLADPTANIGPGKALENALRSAKGFFNRSNESRESLPGSDSDMQGRDSPSAPLVDPHPPNERHATKVKETSPVFHQFLDATYQLLHHHPTRFEFNERFLRRLLYHLYSCQYGTFLFDSEKERVDANIRHRSRSVWDYFLSRRPQFINDKYDPVVDDNAKGKERMLFPELDNTRWWFELFGRTNEEMNGPPVTAQASSSFAPSETQVHSDGPQTVLSAVERSERNTTMTTLVDPGSRPASRPRTPIPKGDRAPPPQPTTHLESEKPVSQRKETTPVPTIDPVISEKDPEPFTEIDSSGDSDEDPLGGLPVQKNEGSGSLTAGFAKRGRSKSPHAIEEMTVMGTEVTR